MIGKSTFDNLSLSEKLSFLYRMILKKVNGENSNILNNLVLGYNVNNGGLESGTINSAGTPVAGAYIRSINFIKVKPSTSYTISNDKSYLFRTIEYDSNKGFIIRRTPTTSTYTITTSATTEYIKVATYASLGNDDLNTKVMINEGDVARPYEPYGLKIPSSMIKQDFISLEVSKLFGKLLVTFGDSITWYDGKPFNASHIEEGIIVKGYQSYIREELGMIVQNQGLSGRTMPEIWNDVISTYPFGTTIDYVSITSGANDHRKGTPIGSILPIGSTFDTATFYGALQASIERILNVNNKTKIFLFTPIKGWYNEQGTSNVPNPTGIGIMSEIYSDAIKEVGKLYSVCVLDWYNESTINEITRPLLIGDKVGTPYYLHPTNLGYKRMAEVLIPFLRNS